MPKKSTQLPRIMVVEDHQEWFDELVMMYCRILQGVRAGRKGEIDACRTCQRLCACQGTLPTGDELTDNVHDNIVRFTDGREAIHYLNDFSTQRGTPRQKVDLISLDINLTRPNSLDRQHGEVGLDVLDAATIHGWRVTVISVTGCASDDTLPDDVIPQVPILQDILEEQSRGECRVYQKVSESASTIRKQVELIETRLTRKHLGDMVSKTRESTTRLDGRFLCLHFVIPDADFDVAGSDWIYALPQTYEQLNAIDTWRNVFHRMEDEGDAFDQIPARLLYLVKPAHCLKYFSIQDDPSSPAPIGQWIEFDHVSPAQRLLLVRLIMRQSRMSSDSFEDEFRVCGLIEPSRLPWAERKKTSARADPRDLSIRTTGADKKNRSDLNANIKRVLGVNDDVIVANDGEYSLEIDGHAFLHRASAVGVEASSNSVRMY